ncbi:MAG TPA: molybdenum ABC transporter ATP-binding protein [Devosiaceae bacterium]|nr:molybdenum ABC transporter ATP-binding protein [Devosiaceae bacterium]
MSALAVRLAGRRGGFSLEAAFEVPAGGVTALFGPSGSGKTSLLRAIAGLDRLAGRCALGEAVWQDEGRFLPPHRRAVGYVFQEASLFAHLDVRQNLVFAERRAPAGGALIGFEEAVAMFGIAPLLGRRPGGLSGGERQRVALARVLLSQPEVLLLDEPLSALDQPARDEILPYFEMLKHRVALPVLLVTHDLADLERLADRVVVLEAGRVVGSGALNDVLVGESALTRRRDAAAVLPGRIRGFTADGLSEIAVAGEVLLVAGRAGQAGDAVRVRIAARDVSLAVERPSQTTILNILRAEIAAVAPIGEAEVLVTLTLGGERLMARVTRRSAHELALAPGREVFAQVKSVSLAAGSG